MKIKSIGNIAIEIDGLKFTIRPRKYLDIISSRDQVRNFATMQGKSAGLIAADMMERVVSWEGVEGEDGKPAPCNDEYKNALFTQRLDLLNKLLNAYYEKESSELKNSGASQTGCETGPTQEPAKPAEA